MKFLADMGVSWRVVQWLRDQQHDVLHLPEIGQEKMPDPGIFALAGAEQRVVLTFDLDFGEIAAQSGQNQPSVIVFRLANTRPHNVIQRLATALGSASEAIEQGSIIFVEQTRIRIRRLPIGG